MRWWHCGLCLDMRTIVMRIFLCGSGNGTGVKLMRSNQMMNFLFFGSGISTANWETCCYAGDGVISIFIKTKTIGVEDLHSSLNRKTHIFCRYCCYGSRAKCLWIVCNKICKYLLIYNIMILFKLKTLSSLKRLIQLCSHAFIKCIVFCRTSLTMVTMRAVSRWWYIRVNSGGQL